MPPTNGTPHSSAGINFRDEQLRQMDSLIGDYSNRSPFVRDAVDVMFYTDDELKAHNVFVRPDKLDEWIQEAVDEKIEREAD